MRFQSPASASRAARKRSSCQIDPHLGLAHVAHSIRPKHAVELRVQAQHLDVLPWTRATLGWNGARAWVVLYTSLHGTVRGLGCSARGVSGTNPRRLDHPILYVHNWVVSCTSFGDVTRTRGLGCSVRPRFGPHFAPARMTPCAGFFHRPLRTSQPARYSRRHGVEAPSVHHIFNIGHPTMHGVDRRVGGTWNRPHPERLDGLLLRAVRENVLLHAFGQRGEHGQRLTVKDSGHNQLLTPR